MKWGDELQKKSTGKYWYKFAVNFGTNIVTTEPSNYYWYPSTLPIVNVELRVNLKRKVVLYELLYITTGNAEIHLYFRVTFSTLPGRDSLVTEWQTSKDFKLICSILPMGF